MKNIFVILIAAGTSLTGCKKFLVVTPETQLTSETFFQSESDFKQAVNATYTPMRGIYNTTKFLTTEMHSDNAYYYRNTLFGATEQQENLADFAITVSGNLTTNSNVLSQYRAYYQIISRANQILTTIDAVDFSADSKNNLKGQALFLRAWSYFDLVRLFGAVPLHLVPATTREETALPLTQVDSIYLQIEKDAQEAIMLLPNKATQEPGRATSGAAKTLLADVYITREQWALAEPLLTDVITNDRYALMPTYAEAFSNTISNKNNQESVFEVQYMEGSDNLNGAQIYNMLPMPLSSAEIAPIIGVSNPQDLSGEGNNAPTPDLIAAYETGDARKDATIGYVTASGSLRTDKTYPYCLKYAKPHALWNNTGVNIPVYRYSEVLLLLAESLNEQGKTTDAIPYLNQVRTRAGLAGTPASSQSAVHDAIIQERRVELAFECKRWFDLVRTGTAVDVITAYGERVKANPEAYYYPPGAVPPNNAFTVITPLYPLPADEGALNPNF
jgi:starch-binding outer membrane protein, SusD/RagB family